MLVVLGLCVEIVRLGCVSRGFVQMTGVRSVCVYKTDHEKSKLCLSWTVYEDVCVSA